MWVPSSVGGDSGPDEHQGWVSKSCSLMQVSYVVSPKTKGNVQLSQPLNGGYVGDAVVADHVARNPGNV